MKKIENFKNLKKDDYVLVVYHVASWGILNIAYGKITNIDKEYFTYSELAEGEIENSKLIGFKAKGFTSNKRYGHIEYTDVYLSPISIPILEYLIEKYKQ